jgi:hypothetical protein
VVAALVGAEEWRDLTLAGAQPATMAVARNPSTSEGVTAVQRCSSERWFRAATLTAVIDLVNAITVAWRSPPVDFGP